MVLSSSSLLGGIMDTRQHVASIAHFLRLHEWLWRAHVVDFFHVSTLLHLTFYIVYMNLLPMPWTRVF